MTRAYAASIFPPAPAARLRRRPALPVGTLSATADLGPSPDRVNSWIASSWPGMARASAPSRASRTAIPRARVAPDADGTRGGAAARAPARRRADRPVRDLGVHARAGDGRPRARGARRAEARARRPERHPLRRVRGAAARSTTAPGRTRTGPRTSARRRREPRPDGRALCAGLPGGPRPARGVGAGRRARPTRALRARGARGPRPRGGGRAGSLRRAVPPHRGRAARGGRAASRRGSRARPGLLELEVRRLASVPSERCTISVLHVPPHFLSVAQL